jgi:hypothetical protein
MIILSIDHMFVGMVRRIYVQDYPKMLSPLKNIALSHLLQSSEKVKLGHPMLCNQANIILGFYSSISSNKRDI